MSDLRDRLHMHGIVDLDQMAVVLAKLVEQVDRQNKTILDLKESLSLYVTKDTFYERLSSVEANLESAWEKINAIHEATTATAIGKKISAGDLASSNFRHICNLTSLVMECATKVELEVQKKELSGVQFNLAELRRDFDKSLGVIDGLSKSQLHQSERILALESAVAGKIDRSEVDHLQSLVAKVLLYDAFKTDTIEALRRLHAFRDHTISRCEEYEEHLRMLDEAMQEANATLSRTATKRDTHQLAGELQRLEERLRDYALCEQLAEVRRAGESTAQRLTACGEEVAALQRVTTQHQTELSTKATVQAVRECVLRRHYEQAVTALGAEIEQRATQSQADSLDDRLQALEGRAETDRERLAVAVRFVEWFTSRGENYEHNIKAIDKHLKGLIVSPAPVRGAAGGDGGAAAVNILGMGGLSTAGASSSVHSYYLPGNRLSFMAQSDHAP